MLVAKVCRMSCAEASGLPSPWTRSASAARPVSSRLTDRVHCRPLRPLRNSAGVPTPGQDALGFPFGQRGPAEGSSSEALPGITALAGPQDHLAFALTIRLAPAEELSGRTGTHFAGNACGQPLESPRKGTYRAGSK